MILDLPEPLGPDRTKSRAGAGRHPGRAEGVEVGESAMGICSRRGLRRKDEAAAAGDTHHAYVLIPGLPYAALAAIYTV